ncbi:MAG: 23S rRNA (adenine(2503)-C(2))-methyltransferase RlmN [Lactobacillales bacterium]|nr:23S rRNA (adenine(2503)-C(2))-methyltransferase RlmN [Lactobacillales bacterium]
MKNIYDYTLEELEEYFISIGEKKFKAIQLFEWLYKKRVDDFDLMSNIKIDTLNKLKSEFEIGKLEIIKKQEDKDVVKYLFNLNDNNKVEAVLMLHDYGNSLCVSTQVGCNMGCSFCESGRLKKVRNLSTYEMVMQILKIEEDLNLRISHVVLMGIGEPFDNYDNVIRFIKIINSGKGIDIGARHITVSTCGIVPKIEEFIKDGNQINLAISLHAPNNEIRDKIMKINKVYKIEELIKVLKKYIEKTNRRVTFEYILLDNVNDSKECAIELSKLLKGMNCYVNLIPYNETSHIEYKKSSKEKIMNFYDTLKKNNINVTIRREFGSKVDAACGQLRANYEEAI